MLAGSLEESRSIQMMTLWGRIARVRSFSCLIGNVRGKMAGWAHARFSLTAELWTD